MDLLGDSSSYLKSIEVLCNESTHHLLATKDESHQPKVDSNSTSNPLLFTDSLESEKRASNNVPNSSCCSEIKDKKKNANNFGEHPKSEVEGCSGKADTENNRTLKSLCINENKVKEAIEHSDKNVLSYPGSNANVNENFVDSSNSKKNIDLDIEIESKFSKDNANSVNDHRGSKTSIIIENSACSLETNNEEEIKTIKTVDGSVLHHIVAAISPNVVTDTNSNSSDLSHAIEKVPFGKSEELQSRNLIEQSDSKQNTSSSGDESDLEMRAIDNFLNCTYPEENLLFEKIGEKSDKEFNSSLVSSQSLVEAFDFVTKQDSPLDKNSKNFSSPFSTIEDSKNLTLDSISVGSSTSKDTESDHLSDKSVNQNDKSGIITPVDKLVKNEYIKMPKSKSEPVFDENELCNSFENFSLFDFNKHSKSDSNIIGNSTSVNNYKPKFRCMDKISRSAITDRFRKLSEVYQIKHTENSKDACLESKNAPNQDCSKNTTSCEESVILKPWYKIFRKENLKDDNKKPVREKSIFTIPTTSDKNIDSSTIENKTGESKSIKEDSSLYAFKDHCANIRTNVSEDLVNNPSVKEFSKGNKIKDNLFSDCSKQTENSSAKSALFSTLSKPKLDLSNFKFPTSRHENGDKMDSNLSDVTKMNENEVNPIEKTCEEVSSGCNQDKDSRVVSTISNSSNSSKEDLTTSKLSTQQNENKICVLKKAEKGNESEINFVPICSTLNSGNCVSSPSNISENSKLSQKSSSEENEKGNQTKMSILKELAEKNNENEVKPVSKNLTPSNFKGFTAIQSNTSDNSKLALPSMNFSVKERQIHQSEISVMKQSEDMNNGNKLEFSGNPIANSLPELNGNHNGDFSESNLSNQKHDACFLQPIQSKIIVLTLDSCVLEADIGKCKKYVFCLKSTFHCDEHDDCMNCFNSLSIGDSVLCYLSPNKDPKCGNMLFSFMFCKDSDVKIKKSKFGCEKGSTSSYCDNNQFLKKTKTKVLECQTDFSDQISSSFVQEECHRENSSIYSNNQNKLLSNIETKASECQTDFNDLTNAAKEKMFEAGFQTKLSKVCQTDFCDQKEIGEEKACQTKIQIVSQEVQTKNSKMKLSTVEKECQINVQTVMQETQTDLKLIENGCQTDLIGAVKPCLPAVDESCQVSCSIRSQGVQTVLQSSQTISQTDITGAIRPLVPVSSFKSQTILSGPVRKCVYLAHKSSQSALLSGVSHATQTTDSICTLESHRMAYPKTTDSKTDKNATALSGQQQAADEMCDIGSQTISTGAIMIKKYFMEETGKDAKH